MTPPAIGLRLQNEADLPGVFTAAFAASGPVLVDIPVDYTHNVDFAADLLPHDFH
jgi:acetolactate synthase-1/2/3 large subunit